MAIIIMRSYKEVSYQIWDTRYRMGYGILGYETLFHYLIVDGD